jgi:hypothetical protein
MDTPSDLAIGRLRRTNARYASADKDKRNDKDTSTRRGYPIVPPLTKAGTKHYLQNSRAQSSEFPALSIAQTAANGPATSPVPVHSPNQGRHSRRILKRSSRLSISISELGRRIRRGSSRSSSSSYDSDGSLARDFQAAYRLSQIKACMGIRRLEGEVCLMDIVLDTVQPLCVSAAIASSHNEYRIQENYNYVVEPPPPIYFPQSAERSTLAGTPNGVAEIRWGHGYPSSCGVRNGGCM